MDTRRKLGAERARQIASHSVHAALRADHESPRTTGLYDRTSDAIRAEDINNDVLSPDEI